MDYNEKLEALRVAMPADTEDFYGRSGYNYPGVELPVRRSDGRARDWPHLRDQGVRSDPQGPPVRHP